MIFSLNSFPRLLGPQTTILLCLSVVFFFALWPWRCIRTKVIFAVLSGDEKRPSSAYNRSGTVTVEGWDRAEISISAYLEAPAANIVPQSLERH